MRCREVVYVTGVQVHPIESLRAFALHYAAFVNNAHVSCDPIF